MKTFFLLVFTFLCWHWAACATAPLAVRYAEPGGCGSDGECCERFGDCDVDFMADVREGEQR